MMLEGKTIGPALLLLAAAIPPTGAQAQLDRLQDLRAAIIACWAPPATSVRLEMTVRFSLDRRGAMNGPPAVTHVKLGADQNTNREFIASVLAAFTRCTPVEFSPSFADMASGRVLTMRFVLDTQGKLPGPPATSL